MRKRILYVFRSSAHHYKTLDLKILGEKFDVTPFCYDYSPSTIRRLRTRLCDSELIFIWFASPFAAIAAYFAKQAGIPCVIVAGGFDVANYKPLRHGSAYRPFQRNLIRYALENASMVLPVSKFNQGELLRFARPQRHRMIYNGLDLDIHAPLTPFQDRKHQIVTVGAVDRHYSKLKGHPQFAKLAANFNQAQFILIGPIKDIEYKKHLDKIAQGRITFAGEKSHDDVIRCFQESRIYLQLSLYESFGLTVPEAMACGCIPVVSANGALPEVVGPVGEIHEPDDHQSILNTLHTCIQSPPRELEVYHKQAMHFAPHIRRQELLEAVHEILSSRPR